MNMYLVLLTIVSARQTACLYLVGALFLLSFCNFFVSLFLPNSKLSCMVQNAQQPSVNPHQFGINNGGDMCPQT